MKCQALFYNKMSSATVMTGSLWIDYHSSECCCTQTDQMICSFEIFFVYLLTCSSDMYMIHLYCFAVQAGFYSDMVEYWPVTQVRSPVAALLIRIFHPLHLAQT